MKPRLIAMALEAGFCRARILVPFHADPSAIVVALAYGNDDPDKRDTSPTQAAQSPSDGQGLPSGFAKARLDLFSRRNYYAEAVKRLKALSLLSRSTWGGAKSDYRILCNSSIPEKPLALVCGLGWMGRNSLIMTPEAGSLVVIAIMTLPFTLSPDPPLETQTMNSTCSTCLTCSACVDACPTGALDGNGKLDRSRCLQWFASRPGEVPPEIAARWGGRLYGCSVCRDVCPANLERIAGVASSMGPLPEAFDAKKLVAASDDQLRTIFRKSALGMSWLGPQAIRRNAALVLSSWKVSNGNGK